MAQRERERERGTGTNEDKYVYRSVFCVTYEFYPKRKTCRSSNIDFVSLKLCLTRVGIATESWHSTKYTIYLFATCLIRC